MFKRVFKLVTAAWRGVKMPLRDPVVAKYWPFYLSYAKCISTGSTKPILYGDEASPPVRFVLMTASHLGIELDFQKIDLFCGENNSEFYKRINPLQKVPALAVDNEVIKDSHAIALYLCKRKKDKELYPEDIKVKTKIDEMLFFNAGSLFPLDSSVLTAYFAGKGPVEERQIENWNCMMDYLEGVLSKSKWLAGEKMTLCDLCCAATVSSLRLLIPPLERHEKINQWLANLKQLPFYDINIKGLDRLQDFVEKVYDVAQ